MMADRGGDVPFGRSFSSAAVFFSGPWVGGDFAGVVLRKSMKGLGTNDTTLIRVVVTRTEIDMQYIKAEYQKKYKKPLGEAIRSETSGHYRTFLLSLVG